MEVKEPLLNWSHRMNDEAFVQALGTVADELLRRANVTAGDDMMEPCNLVLTNTATGLLIALNHVGGHNKLPSMMKGE